MKRGFLVPTAVAVAALTPPGANAAAAAVDKTIHVDRTAENVRPNSLPSNVATYAVGTDLFGFVVERSANGTLTAFHYSHSSHASHASHASHYSGR